MSADGFSLHLLLCTASCATVSQCFSHFSNGFDPGVSSLFIFSTGISMKQTSLLQKKIMTLQIWTKAKCICMVKDCALKLWHNQIKQHYNIKIKYKNNILSSVQNINTVRNSRLRASDELFWLVDLTSGLRVV